MSALSELTDKEALLRAIDEFKDLGREAFLEKYGQHASARYFVSVDGLHIDSKPLLSVAYGYQFPDRGPLNVRHFAGGAETRAALARFGYELVVLPEMSSGVVYGEIEECPAGTVFKNRREAFDAGVHRTTQAGIAGQAVGTQSICLSEGYSDDEIDGDLITYTGFGGRDASTGKHIADQQLVQGNLGLVENYNLGRPVRVLVKLSVLSGNSSDTEYLYLGLFEVVSWSWGTRDGWKVLVYQLCVLGNQSLVPEEVAFSLARGEELPALRKSASVTRLVRNSAVARSVKKLYADTCQMCGLQLRTAAGTYSEAAHIRPLGIPHRGPDSLSNLLCLCPNCHTQFDGHALTVAPDGTVLKFDVPVGQLTVDDRHRLDFDQLEYQREISTGNTEQP